MLEKLSLDIYGHEVFITLWFDGYMSYPFLEVNYISIPCKGEKQNIKKVKKNLIQESIKISWAHFHMFSSIWYYDKLLYASNYSMFT